ncbi:MAG: Rpn family recombination-promoting nuclease/putative transposase [Planctomycetaceae bacterium]|jgi:predicted transposase/invertase (TIGR01784 family)|nr:Rpn family recombination-promoting nuclease/putative transposase [Planctomycetaceae bacterium]
MDQDFFSIKPTSDIFIVTFLSSPKSEPLLRGIINAVLKNKSGRKPIEHAFVCNPFNITDYTFDKRIALDVRVTDCSGSAFNIEIQTYPHPAFRERILYGWSDSYSSQLIIGGNYTDLIPVITIVITEFPIFPKSKKVHLFFELRECEDTDLVLSEHIQIHFWQLHEVIRGHDEVLDEVSPDLAHWSQFFAHGSEKSEVEMSLLTENDPQVMDAYREFRRFTSDPKTQELARRRRMFEMDYQVKLNAAEAKGKTETEEKWHADIEEKEKKWQANLAEEEKKRREEEKRRREEEKKRREAEEKRREAEEKRREAEEKRREAEEKRRTDKIETARQFKLLGIDCEKIAQITGLSLDEVKRLN